MSEWKSIDSLIKSDTDLSEYLYSYDFACRIGLISESDVEDSEKYCREHPEDTEWVRAPRWCPQYMEIKEAGGQILWRVVEEDYVSVKDYQTQFGVYKAENRGEFGGEIFTPGGKCYGGNYCDVFDHGDKVYAVDSMGHMCFSHFGLNCFGTADDYTTIYSIGYDLGSAIEEEISGNTINVREQLTYEGRYITDEQAFVMISGYVEEKNKANSYRHLTRILRIKDEIVEVYKELPYIISNITSFVIRGNMLYLGKNNTLEIIDMDTDERSYLTFLDDEARADMLKNGRR